MLQLKGLLLTAAAVFRKHLSLSPGHYRVVEKVDKNTSLVFAIIPGGGRDIPLLVQDVPAELQQKTFGI